MTTDEQKTSNAQTVNGDKITVKRADLEAYRRKMARARRTLETASTLLDELESEYDKLTDGSAAIS